MNADSKESAFQRDIIDQMVAGGWKLGDPAGYDRKLALYTDDCLQYVMTTQPKTWEKYQTLYPAGPEQAFIDKLASQLSKADPQATDKSLRTFGTLGVLRHELRDKSASFKMCQFKPEHGLNPDTLAMYEGNILHIVPELVYSPYATVAELAETGNLSYYAFTATPKPKTLCCLAVSPNPVSRPTNGTINPPPFTFTACVRRSRKTISWTC